jgi:hypothetical protein
MQIRRGNVANLPNLAQGEPGFCLDSEELYIGGMNGNVLINNPRDYVSVLKFGAKGDGVTDDTAAFLAAIAFCQENGRALYIPRVNDAGMDAGYILSKTLNITKPMTIIADPLSRLWWKDAHSVSPSVPGIGENGSSIYESGFGINIDYGTYTGLGGFYRFGWLVGDGSYIAPGATKASGKYWTGVRIANGDMVNLYCHYMCLWERAFLVEATVNTCMDNIINFNNCDLCLTGIEISAKNTYSISGIEVKGHTIGLCQYGIVLSSDNNNSYVGPNNIEIFDVWSEAPNGACIYSNTTISQFVNGNIVKVKRIHGENTILGAVYYGASVFKNPFISGTHTLNGENGYFWGDTNLFEIGAYESIPAAGDPIRIKFAGADNVFRNLRMNQNGFLGASYTPSSVQGESNFNGGTGSALMANYAVFRVSMGAHIKNDITSFFTYAQNINCNWNAPIKVIPLSSYQGVFSVMAMQTGVHNREIEIKVVNLDNNADGYTIDFAIEFSQM